jgi:hypothetical protein
MKRFSRSRVFGWTLCGLLVTVLVQSCGASEAELPAGGAGGTGGTDPADSGDATIDVVPPDNGGAGGESPYNPLCGIVSCVPDDESACPPTSGGSSGNAGSSASGGTATGGTTGDGGRGSAGAPDGAGRAAGGASDGGEGGEGGEGNAGGRAGDGTSGTSGRGGGGSVPVVNSCQVRPKNAQPLAQCLPAGTGTADAPCLSSDDCAPGLACVEEGDAGQCRPYCCVADRCPDRTHCFERTLFGVTPSLEVPVCVPAVDCGLAEPFPCPEGATCSCPDGLACMVIGIDRTTTCVPPGRGYEGQDCPCQWGYVCSQVTNQCVKLCQTTAPEASCSTGMCQASAELPSGWGVCIGTARPDGG